MYCISGECVPDSTNKSLHFCEILAWYDMVTYNYESSCLEDDFNKDIAKKLSQNYVYTSTMCTTRCPVENDEKLSPTPVLNNTQKFTVYIKNSVAFPYFGMEYRKNNILGKYF